MKPALRIGLCISALPVVIGAANLCDRWILSRAAVPFDGTHAWARSISLIAISLLLLVISRFVVGGTASRLIASVYLVGGLLLTLLQPLAVSAMLSHSTSLLSLLTFLGPLLQFLLGCGAVSNFTFAFVAAIGVGAFLHPYVFPNTRNA